MKEANMKECVYSCVISVCVFVLAWSCVHAATGHHTSPEDHYLGGELHSDDDIDTLFRREYKEWFGKLSPSEQGERLTEIVKKIDTNSDLHLTEGEISQWIQKVHRQYALDDAMERFPKLDTNNDAIVTWEEYNRHINDEFIDYDENEISDDPEEDSLQFLQLKEMQRYNFADSDGTPGLNLEEFLAFTHPPEVDHMADYAIQDVLHEYDQNADGLISLQEYLENLRTNYKRPSQWEWEETIRFEELYDQDKDGQLNREEQLLWVAPNSYTPAREEALHLIKELDRNGDKILSVSEILSNAETFLNSEVTDFGRGLHNMMHDEL